MLIQFTVGNYRSFKEPVTLSMVAAKIGSKDKELDANTVFKVDDNLSLLTSAAIYGANASGKSNLVAAIRFMRQFVLSSSRDTQAADPIGAEPFRLSTETEGQPSHFEVVFRADGKQYRYGFEVDTERVVAEWLFHVPKSREARLFEREGEEIHLGSGFREGRGLEARTRANALFLSVVAQFNGAVSTTLLRWFRDNGAGFEAERPVLYAGYEFSLLTAPDRDEAVEFIKRLDLGIRDIELIAERYSVGELSRNSNTPAEGPKRYAMVGETELLRVKTLHQKYGRNGQLVSSELLDLEQHESAGTKKLFAFIPTLLETLRKGKIVVVDELDARLHPLITFEIIKLFNSRATNPHHAQLIFTTHDTNLLSGKLFRRDQIWFTEKSAQGATALYSLVEYKLDDNTKVRNDASYEKNYIEGRYGAIPYIGDLRQLIEGHADAE